MICDEMINELERGELKINPETSLLEKIVNYVNLFTNSNKSTSPSFFIENNSNIYQADITVSKSSKILSNTEHQEYLNFIDSEDDDSVK